MKFLKSLRGRFALWTAVLLFAGLLLFGLFVYTRMARNLVGVVDETLHSIVLQLTAEPGHSGPVALDDLAEDPEFTRLREQGFSLRVLDPRGRSIQEYGPYLDLPWPQPNAMARYRVGEYRSWRDPTTQDPLRVYTVAIVDEDEIEGLIQAAYTLKSVNRTLNSLLFTLLIGAPLAAVVAGSGGYFLAARALRPIDKIIRTARHISTSDLSARLHLPTTDDEVGRLATTFDSMLARLEDGFHRERQFTADASHELRTPLTAMHTIIDTTMARQREPLAYEQALADLRHEVEQMRALTAGLLDLARHDVTRQSSELEVLDLVVLLDDVVDSLLPLAEDKGLQLLAKLPKQPLMITGESDGLIRLFVNLLDNAIKYTTAGTIAVAASQEGDEWVNVQITDTGVGIPAAQLPHIFDRFYRVDPSRSTAGIGLGLAIARDIVHAHGGTIAVESVVGQGTTFTVRLLKR